MKTSLIISFLITVCMFYGCNNNSTVKKETIQYAEKGDQKLYLDKYESGSSKEKKPCIIFLFGGGFSSGNRDSETYVPFFHYWAQKGYVVASIDYRLGLKNIESTENMNMEDLAQLFVTTIEMAVEDLFSATGYILQHADEWGVDRSMLITCGSSAGAITVLQAEYALCNTNIAGTLLPDGFNFAGTISFAGAIVGLTPELQWQTIPSPLMLFHGDADDRVPYNKAAIDEGGMFGSSYISDQLTLSGIPHYFYSIENAAHEVATTPMKENLKEIEIFIQKLIREKEDRVIRTDIERPGVSGMKKDYELMDYVKNNF